MKQVKYAPKTIITQAKKPKATKVSSLAKMIRQCEENNSQRRKVRIKVVERSERSVKNTLAPSYPWSPEVCIDPK